MGLPTSLADWLSYQERLHPSAIDLGLARVREVAQRLGLLDAPPITIIVGGTNGKGSTTTLLAGLYREAGYRVGAYTSPHLFRYNERVAIDGEPASDATLCEAFTAIEQARAEVSLSYFEFGTLAALWLFRAAKVDVQVLEVGLGGRLDAVNILDADAAVVTNIGLDHQDWLGHDRHQIGREKAGIFRRGRHAVIADRAPPAGLLAAADAAGAAPWRFDRGDYRHRRSAEGWHWSRGERTSPLLPEPALEGAHQFDNAAGAIATAIGLEARLPFEWSAVQRALRRLHLPGRMQRAGGGRPWLLDVAHNAEAATALAAVARERFGSARAIWIVGMLADKPVEAIAATLRSVVSMAISCDLPSPRSLEAAGLAARLEAVGVPTITGGEPQAALASALQRAEPAQPILISGSFLTVAALAPLIPHD